MSQFSEQNVFKSSTSTTPDVTQELGESTNELTMPEAMSLTIKKLNIIIDILLNLAGPGVAASDYDLADSPNSTTT